MIGSKCYSACDNGYSADSTGTLCIQNCASGETSTATTCTKPRIDNMQSSCCDGEFVPCEAVNGRSFFCYDGGYPFPINQCHCRSDAVTYTKATNNRNWQCPAGTYPNQGSCVASNIQPRHIRRSQHEAIHRYQCSVPSNHCYGYLVETFQEALL